MTKATAKTFSPEIKLAARGLYLQHTPVTEIAAKFGVSGRTIYNWRDEGDWDNIVAGVSVEHAISVRIIELAARDNKSDAELKEMDSLINQLEKLARVRQIEAKTKMMVAANDGAPLKTERADKKKKSSVKNDISEITKEQLDEIRSELFWGYQQNWNANKHQKTRFILKSRQIGATMYFSWEALEDAILSGDNQLFLSASKSQAEVFKAYIIGFGIKYFGIDFKGGDCITLSNGANLRFLSTNGRTAQSYNGHLYIDEVFWIHDFKKLNEVASAMASQKKWRLTYFSTPSIKTHGAFPMWSGEQFNKEQKKPKEFDLSHEALKDGLLGPDRIWRNIVNVKDAEQQGCNLFDIEDLKFRYSESAFNNLFMCAFLEAGMSVFNLGSLLSCAVESNVVWVDFKRKELRPYGNNPVWLGYDPARRGDKSTVVIVAPPVKQGGKFRVLEKINVRGAWQHQADCIIELTDKYNIQFMGIDCTGPGSGVFEMVQAKFPKATAINYNLDTKTRLVLKMQDLVERQRIEWDVEHTDIPQALLQVHMTSTGNDQITYSADRSSETGHADVGFALMHAVSNEPLNINRRKSGVAMSN